MAHGFVLDPTGELQEQVGEGILRFPLKYFDEVMPIPDEAAQGEIRGVALVGFGEAAESKEFGDDVGIDEVGFIGFRESPFEVVNSFGVDEVDEGFPGREAGIGGKVFRQMEAVEVSGFQSQAQMLEPAGLKKRQEASLQVLGAGEGVGDLEGFSEGNTVLIAEGDSGCVEADVDSYVQDFSHDLYHRPFGLRMGTPGFRGKQPPRNLVWI
jgi:hypothetical protein